MKAHRIRDMLVAQALVLDNTPAGVCWATEWKWLLLHVARVVARASC